MKKVLVALSGGVDSAVAATLLKEQGYTVSGAYMRTWMHEEGSELFADCPWETDREDARAVAETLDIPFEVVNLIDGYQEHVVRYLVDGYKRGVTPNPDIMCNRQMKFGMLLQYALDQGFDFIATGHYCQKRELPEGGYGLFEGVDKNKDQSYFLAMVKQEGIARALFPLGGYTKPQIRELAEKAGLPNAQRKDSQGICFLGKVPIQKFLEQYIPDKPGDVVNLEGKKVGTHEGLHRFTFGQRKGIGVPSNTDFENFVVLRKDYDTNQLIVAFDKPDTPGLYMTEKELEGMHFINEAITEETELLAKPRYRDPSQKVRYIPMEEGKARVVFEKPQRALAAGQVLALYDGERVLGGGYYC